jgi:micrococcal nuclease
VPATVLEVVDGDTLRLELDLGWHIKYTTRVRIARINAPECKTPEGDAAKSYANTLVHPGDEVIFTSQRLDKYGRPLGTVTYGGFSAKDFADDMVHAGHAAYVNW